MSPVITGFISDRRAAQQTSTLSSVKAKFHYASWFEAGCRSASNQLRSR